MASTNKTTNYDLSQFLGTDKPAWLADYNSDMQKIDAQMKLNANAASTADGKATTANTNVGTLSNLTTTAKTDLVSAVNEVNTGTSTATNLANQALNKSNTNESSISSLNGEINKFNLTDFRQPSVSGSGMTITLNEIKSAVNSDGSLGKIYGSIFATVTSSSANLTIADTGFRPTTDINVDGICIRQDLTSGSGGINILPITIKTDGTIVLQNNFTSGWNGRNVVLLFPACVVFAKDFGD